MICVGVGSATIGDSRKKKQTSAGRGKGKAGRTTLPETGSTRRSMHRQTYELCPLLGPVAWQTEENTGTGFVGTLGCYDLRG